ncbi:hypothetical protein H4R18_001515 [Coemansia javaensis]|uniref:Uncharacterized protein n=1 Tax=Coemansia javaensis TaxID=2761396 RepID=A0A9W8HL97_9FUNG|nr:hypothetical protein H4R18_001515 [Coemansia javaensis]
MSATVTATSLLRPLYLFPAPGAGAGSSAFGKSSGESGPGSNEVEALGRRLQEHARISEPDSSSGPDSGESGSGSGSGGSGPDGGSDAAVLSRLVVEADGLCGDAAYVRVDHMWPCSPASSASSSAAAGGSSDNSGCGRGNNGGRGQVRGGPKSPLPPPLAAAAHKKAAAPPCSPLIRPRPKSNPFKTLRRGGGGGGGAGSQTPPGSGSAAAAATQQLQRRRPSHHPPPAQPEPSCVHCKFGSFLEFCRAADRCRCDCHAECPCNPCREIQGLRLHARCRPATPAAAPLARHAARK